MNYSNKIIVIGICMAFLIGACTPMDHYYKDLITLGDKVYTGKVDSVWTYPGNQRIKMMWIAPPDPTADQIRVFWNNNQDSISKSIEYSGETGEVLIEGLSEALHTFNVVTIGNDGNRSLPIEILGQAYGQTYQSNLLNRLIQKAVITTDSTSISFIEELSETLVRTDVHYQDKNGDQQQFSISSHVTDTTLYDIDPVVDITYQSFYLPVPSAIDTFETEVTTTDLRDHQLRELTLTGVGSTTADFIDFTTVSVHKELEAEEQSQNIDLGHLRGTSSKHNLTVLAYTSGFSAFSSSLGDRISGWSTQNDGELINLGGAEEYVTLYDSLDEKDSVAMQDAYNSVAYVVAAPVGRLTLIEAGDIILFKSISKGIYVAIKVITADDDGPLTIAFKVSTP